VVTKHETRKRANLRRKAIPHSKARSQTSAKNSQALTPISDLPRDRVTGQPDALERQEARYRSLVTATAQIVWTTDPEGQVIEPLPSWQEFTGQTPQEYHGSGWIAAVHPEDRDRTSVIWRRAVMTRSLYETEYRLRRHDGQYRRVAVRGVPVVESDGRIREWVGLCTDITERTAEEKRRELTHALLGLFAQKVTLKEYLDSVLEMLRQWCGCEALAIRLLTAQRQIPYAAWIGFEPAFIEREGSVAPESDDCCCTRVFAQTYHEQDRLLLTPGGSYRFDDLPRYFRALPPQKRYHCAEFGFRSLAIIPVRYHGESIGVIQMADRRANQLPLATVEFIESMAPLIAEAVHRFQAETELAQYRDRLEELVRQRTLELEAANQMLQVEILQRQRAQETLLQTAQELERSNRDLEQFAYVASHDLQEPLRAVGGYVKLLQHRFPDDVEPKALEYIAGAADGARRMERLITDLLAFARVGTHSGGFVLADLNTLFREAVHNLQASVLEAGAIVTCETLPRLTVDATQMLQLFQNLIGNAIKFRSARAPRVHVNSRREQDRWIFSVKDNGIGIDAKYYQRIFQIFQRLHTRRQYPGTGIGLAICKKIVERHGGAIWVESAPGEGSTFCFAIKELKQELP
jgi:PAS domain S-box-containing protein